MRYLVLAAALVTACSDDITFGDVEAIDTGASRIHLRACLDEQLLACNGKDVVLSATSAGETGTLTYGGAFFPMHQGSLPFVDRDADIVISNGDATATMNLPPPFEITASAASLDAGQAIVLTWHGDGERMVWAANFQCVRDGESAGGGAAMGDEIDDTGQLVLTTEQIRSTIDERRLPCTVELELSRVRRGTVDGAFHADDATGISRRTATVELR